MTRYVYTGRGAGRSAAMIQDLCYALNAKEKENADLRAKMEAAETAKNELIDDLILERRKSSGHSSESMYFMQQAEKAEQERDNLQAQLITVISERDFKTALIADLHSQISKLLKTNSDNVAEIDNLLSNVVSAEKALADAQCEKARVMLQLKMSERDRNNLLNQLADQKEIAEEYQAKWAEAGVEESQLQAQCAAMRGALESVREQCLDKSLCKFYGWFAVKETVDSALSADAGADLPSRVRELEQAAIYASNQFIRYIPHGAKCNCGLCKAMKQLAALVKDGANGE